MPRAIRTILPPTWFARLRTRWRLSTPDPAARLALLARLLARHVDGILPGLRETRVEQSWNEQIFAGVLGYQTLFSHDQMPYHLEPKRHSHGRYNDFSLGFFGAGRSRIVASAELKGPRADLDAPQAAYDGVTAVEQALSCAVLEGAVWALVSNFVELRLYRVRDARLVAVAKLDRIRNVDDLADVAAIFGRRAILGEQMDESDLGVLLDGEADHPALPLAGAEGSIRVVFRYQPPPGDGVPLYRLEGDLVDFLSDAEWKRWGGETRCVRLVDGWLVAEGASTTNHTHAKIAISSERELVLSARLPARQESGVDPHWVVSVAKLALRGVHAIDKNPRPKAVMEMELLDVAGVKMFSGSLSAPRCMGAGTSERAHITSGAFEAAGNPAMTATGMLLEIAFHFRNEESGVVLDAEKVRQALDK